MLRFAVVLLLVLAGKAQETRPNHFLRGFKDPFPVRRLEDSAPAPTPIVRGYNLVTRKVTVAWETSVAGLTWELQAQRWNRYGDEVLAGWVDVGSSRKRSSQEVQMREVFVDLQRYLYAFRVQAISIDGARGNFSSTTELYGERIDKNVTLSEGTATLRTSDLNNESNPPVLKLSSGVPLKQRGNQNFLVLKNVKVLLELDVQPSFPTFYSWLHKALPIFRRSISKYLNLANATRPLSLSPSASVGIDSCELFLNSTTHTLDGKVSSARKYAALNVSALVLNDISGAEYNRKVDRVRSALQPSEFFHGAWQTFVSELSYHGLLLPDGLALTQFSEVIMEEVEFAVDGALASKQILHSGQDYNMYLLAGGGGVVLIFSLAIFFLVRRYQRLSNVARDLTLPRELHRKEAILDLEKPGRSAGARRGPLSVSLEKQASTVRHEIEEIQHARDAIEHEKFCRIESLNLKKEKLAKQHLSSMCPAISVTGPEQVDPPVKVANEQVLPTLLEAPELSIGGKDGKM